MPDKRKGPRRIRSKHGYRYLDAKGRFTSRAEYKAAKALTEQARNEKKGAVNHWKKRRKAVFTNLGQNVPSRKGNKTKSRLDAWSKLVDSGILPDPDSVSSVQSSHYTGESIVRRYWRFEGIEAEQTVKDLLLLLRDDPNFKGLAQATLGTGFGKDAEWVGTPVDYPENVKRRLDVWQHRASVQHIFNLAEEGHTVWWEVYTDELVKDNKRGNNGKSGRVGPSSRTKQRAPNKSSRKPAKRGTHNRKRPKTHSKGAKNSSRKNIGSKRPRNGKGKGSKGKNR